MKSIRVEFELDEMVEVKAGKYKGQSGYIRGIKMLTYKDRLPQRKYLAEVYVNKDLNDNTTRHMWYLENNLSTLEY